MNKIGEEASVETLNERYIRFLKSRKGQGKKHAEKIVNFLIEQRQKDPDGWVRFKDLKEATNCCDHTLARLLDKLESLLVIQRRGKERTQHDRPGQDPVSYRVTPFAMFNIVTEVGKKKECSRLSEENKRLSENLQAARTVLARHALLEEYAKERETFWD